MAVKRFSKYGIERHFAHFAIMKRRLLGMPDRPTRYAPFKNGQKVFPSAVIEPVGNPKG